MITAKIIPFPIHESINCGGCPVCGRHDGYVNLGPEYWAICHEHKTRWSMGENLFEDWDNQTFAQFHSVEQMLKEYMRVYPM